MADNVNTLWITGYAPTGHRINLTLAVNPDNLKSDIDRLMKLVCEAGIQAREQGIEVGEDTVTVCAAIKREQLRDGVTTPILDLYTERGNYREKPTVYLNTPEEIAAFEGLSGIRVKDMPTFEGDNSLERDNPKFSRFVRQFKQPVTYVRRANPAHQKDSTKPQFKFVRWIGAPAPRDDTWSNEAKKKWWDAAFQIEGVTKEIALSILGCVDSLTEFKGTKSEAFAKLETYKRDLEAES